HLVEQGTCRRLRFVVQLHTLQKLRISLKRRDRVLELVGQSCRHLSKTFEIVLQRHLLAQLSYLRDVRQQAQRASWSTLRWQLDRSNGCTQSTQLSISPNCFDLSAPVDSACLQTVTHHFCQFFVWAEKLCVRLT